MGYKKGKSKNKSRIYAILVLVAGISFFVIKIKETDIGFKVLILAVILAIILFFKEDIEKKNREKKRKQIICDTYPEFVMKFSLLVDAGMTLRQAFERIGRMYLKNAGEGNPLYDEVVTGIRELENGVPEVKVYDNFARRCGSREVLRFAGLVKQNLRKGNAGLKDILRKEASDTLKEAAANVKKKGERASTALLFPMMLLLLIVMIVIMVPAFGMI